MAAYKHLIDVLTIITSYFSYTESARHEFMQPGNASCACLGDILTYTCTAVGGGNTQWGGTTFDCPDTSDEIILRHTFYATKGTQGVCNNGAVTGRSLGVRNGNCYTSQLNVNVQKTSSTVQCVHNADSGPIEIGESFITAVSGPYPPPRNLKIADIQSGNAIFTWDSVALNCSSVRYNITSDCGVCPVTTYSTNVTCSIQQIPSTCVLRVQSIVCGFTGSASAPVVRELNFPDMPNVDKLNIIPHYLQSSSQDLVRLTIIANTTDDILNVTQYHISYFNSNFVHESTKTMETLCVSGTMSCEYTANLRPNQCRSISINISAINTLGAGQPLQHVMIMGCNSFVMVEYDKNTATFSCIFKDSNTKKKSCILSHNSQCGNSSRKLEESPDRVLLRLPSDCMDHQSFCYNITATNGTQTVIVEGCIDNSNNQHNIIAVTISAVTVTVVTIIILFLVIFCLLRQRCASSKNYSCNHYQLCCKVNTAQPKNSDDDHATLVYTVQSKNSDDDHATTANIAQSKNNVDDHAATAQSVDDHATTVCCKANTAQSKNSDDDHATTANTAQSKNSDDDHATTANTEQSKNVTVDDHVHTGEEKPKAVNFNSNITLS